MRLGVGNDPAERSPRRVAAPRPPRAPLPAPGGSAAPGAVPRPPRRAGVPVTATARAPPPSTPITCISGRPSRFVVNTISAPSGDHAGSRSSQSSSRVSRKGMPPSAGSRNRVVAAPDVGGEGDQAAVRGDRRTGAESGLLDMEFAVIVRSLDAEDPAGSGMVGARRNRDQEAAGEGPSPKPGPGSGWISFEPPPHTRMSSPPGATARMSKAPGSRRGIQHPSRSGAGMEVHRRMAGEPLGGASRPPATRQMSRFPSRSREKTSERPSGAQSGSKS